LLIQALGSTQIFNRNAELWYFYPLRKTASSI
jgi:hypothetical protein